MSEIEQIVKDHKGGKVPYHVALDKMVDFIKHQKMKQAIEDAVKKHLPKGNYDTLRMLPDCIATI